VTQDHLGGLSTVKFEVRMLGNPIVKKTVDQISRLMRWRSHPIIYGFCDYHGACPQSQIASMIKQNGGLSNSLEAGGNCSGAGT
jgi:hypothetical protein